MQVLITQRRSKESLKHQIKILPAMTMGKAVFSSDIMMITPMSVVVLMTQHQVHLASYAL